MANSRSIRATSAKSLYVQTCHESLSAMVRFYRPGPYNTIEQSEKCYPSSFFEYEFLPLDATKNLPEVLSAERERYSGNTCKERHTNRRLYDVDTDRSRDRARTKIANWRLNLNCTSGDIAAVEEVAFIGISSGPTWLKM
jgi:hypothetical protein